MEKYDLIIIGGGPSGYGSAMRAIDFKKKTLLIERKSLGGAGVKNGALSSKTWWEISRQKATLNKLLKQFNRQAPKVSFKTIKAQVAEAANYWIDMLTDHMEQLKDSNYANLLTFKRGNAKLISDNEVQITTETGETEVVSGQYIVLATGSRPRKLPHIQIDEKIILTSDGIEALDDFPESMVILGAGVIGCEFATIFSGFEETKVHLIDKGDRILPFEDEDIVEVIEKGLEKANVLIHHNSQLIRMDIVDGRVEYQLQYNDGRKEIFNVEKALISVGRVPNWEGLWEENVKIKLNNRGIEDDDTQTSVKNIYAVGDITADIALVNVGELEGRYAVERIFGKPGRKLVYENISTIMFLNPVVAGVGLNEKQAQEKGISYKVATLDYACIRRAVAKRNIQGFIKMLVTNDEKMKILGMRVVGNHASSAIQAVALLISMDKGIEELAECVHPHPSIIEGIQECVRMLLGKSIFKPEALPDKISCRVYTLEGGYEKILF